MVAAQLCFLTRFQGSAHTLGSRSVWCFLGLALVADLGVGALDTPFQREVRVRGVGPGFPDWLCDLRQSFPSLVSSTSL